MGKLDDAAVSAKAAHQKHADLVAERDGLVSRTKRVDALIRTARAELEKAETALVEAAMA